LTRRWQGSNPQASGRARKAVEEATFLGPGEGKFAGEWIFIFLEADKCLTVPAVITSDSGH
jgi:hypothetical protein